MFDSKRDYSKELLKIVLRINVMVKVIAGINDLASQFPSLLSEWNYIKNEDLGFDPAKLSGGSGKKVWWQCKTCGYEWETSPANRVKGTGCPSCAKLNRAIGRQKAAAKKVGSFGLLYPSLLSEWIYEKNEFSPNDVSPNSTRKAWWRCGTCKNEWEMSIHKRAKGSKCPYCTNERIKSGLNDLSATHPQIAAEWDYEKNIIDPTEVTYGSEKSVWWICKKGHSYEQKINARTVSNVGCSYCSGRKLLKGFNDFATIHKELLSDWNYSKNSFLPEEILGNTSQKLWWKCSLGHEWQDTIVKKKKLVMGCPFCSGQRVIPGFNDLELWCKRNNREDLIDEWNDIRNTTPMNLILKGSSKKVWWMCSLGHEWQATISNRTNVAHPTGCPYCSNKKIKIGYNDLRTWCEDNEKGDILLEWNNDKNGSPEHYLYSSTQLVWWKCDLEHTWQAKISDRITTIEGCPYCSGRKTLSGFNDLQTWCIANSREDLILEWNESKNSFSMDCISPKNHKRVWWKCSEGHEWKTAIHARTRGSRCPFCIGQKVVVGENDLETWCHDNSMDHILQEWDFEKNGDLLPQNFSYGSGISVWWKCKKGHEWKAVIQQRTTRQKTNCPLCARQQTSFPEQSVAFYLMKSFDISQRFRFQGYEVDIYLKDYNIAIEYDGRYFHNKIEAIRKEEEKDAVFEKEGIPLIRIKETIDIREVDRNTIFFPASNGKYITDDFEWAIRQLFVLVGKLIGKEINVDVNMDRDELDIRAHYMGELGSNSVEARFPLLAKEWDLEKNKGVPASAYAVGSNKKVWWKCKKGHSWMAVINSRVGGGHGCPYCAGQKTIAGENDLETWCKVNNRVDLLDEWDYGKNQFFPKDYAKKSNKKVWWKCKCGYEWESSISNRTAGQGCLKCGRKTRQRAVVLIETGDIFESASAAARKYGVTPSGIIAVCNGRHKHSAGFKWKYLEDYNVEKKS